MPDNQASSTTPYGTSRGSTGGGMASDAARREAGTTYGSSANRSGSPGGSAGGGTASDATSTIREAASSVSEMAEDAYKQGSRYVREASDYLPEVDGYAEVVRRPIEQSPLIATVAAGAIGYLAAYLIHGGGLGSQHRARPDYDREYGRSRYDREYGQGQRNSRD